MLAGKVIAEACFSNAGRGGESLCPKTDSMTDAGAFGPRGEDGAAAPCDASLPSCWHGAHVASLAAGNSRNPLRVARGADVVAGQNFTRFRARPAFGGPRPPPPPGPPPGNAAGPA